MRNFRPTLALLSGLGCALISNALRAAEPAAAAEPAVESPPATQPAEPVVISVVGQSSVTELRKSPFPVTVVDVKRYAGRSISLDELLDRSAGVKIRETGGEGSSARISVRGLEGRRVAIFIDGHPVTSPDGSFGINDLPLQLIDRIEIYKGVVPAKLGGDGLGSAVNIVLNDRQQSYSDSGYSYASFDVQRAYTLGKYVDPGHHFKLGAGVILNSAKNDYLMPRADAPSVRREHDRFRSVLAGMSLELNRAWFTKAKLEMAIVANQKQIQGVPAATDASVTQYDIREAQTTSQLLFAAIELQKNGALPGLDLSYDLGMPVVRSQLRDLASSVYDFDGNRLPNPNGRGEIGRGPNDSHNRRWELRHRLNANYVLASGHALNLNNVALYASDRPSDPAANRAVGFNITPYPGSLFRSVTGLAYEAQLLEQRFVVTTGVKHFYYRARGTLTSSYEIFNGTPDRTSQGEQALGGNVAARYQLTRPWLVKASFEHAARLPASDELFGDGFTTQGSLTLKPETSDNVNIGTYFDTGPAAKRLQIAVDVFRSHVKDLITRGGTLTQSYANVGEVRIQGVEADVKADATEFFYVYANCTYQDLRNVADFLPGSTQVNYLKGLVVPNVPRLFANFGVEIHVRDLMTPRTTSRLYYDASYVAQYFYEYQVSNNQERILPAYFVSSLGLQQTFAEGRYSLDFEAVNLANVQRYDDFNRPLPGRSFRIFARATFL